MNCIRCDKELIGKSQKKFCSLSCSATYNMMGKPSRNSVSRDTRACKNCGTGINYRKTYCSDACKNAASPNIQYIDRWLLGEETGLANDGYTIRDIARTYLLKACNHSCEQCGWNTVSVYTGRCPLHIDHIDGNYKNCSRENLRVLCPNCHALTSTYGSLNRGKGRPYYIQKTSV